MNTKKWIGVVAALGLSASLAVAAETAPSGQGYEGRGQHEFRGGERLADKLNLTDAQKAQWKQMDQAFRDQNKAFFDQARQTMMDFRAAKDAGDTAKMEALKPAFKAQRQQMKQLRDAQEQRLVTILTAEQRAQFDALKAERAAHRGEHRGHNEQE